MIHIIYHSTVADCGSRLGLVLCSSALSQCWGNMSYYSRFRTGRSVDQDLAAGCWFPAFAPTTLDWVVHKSNHSAMGCNLCMLPVPWWWSIFIAPRPRCERGRRWKNGYPILFYFINEIKGPRANLSSHANWMPPGCWCKYKWPGGVCIQIRVPQVMVILFTIWDDFCKCLIKYCWVQGIPSFPLPLESRGESIKSRNFFCWYSCG